MRRKPWSCGRESREKEGAKYALQSSPLSRAVYE